MAPYHPNRNMIAALFIPMDYRIYTDTLSIMELSILDSKRSKLLNYYYIIIIIIHFLEISKLGCISVHKDCFIVVYQNILALLIFFDLPILESKKREKKGTYRNLCQI